MSRLMSTDFYKKRSFSPVEMKELQKETGTEGYDRLLEHQTDCLQGQIMGLQEMFPEVGSSEIRNSKNFSNPLLTWGFPPALLCMEKGGGCNES